MKKIEHTRGSDNIFADLGIDNSQEYLQKAKLASRISGIMKERGLTQTDAAKLLGVDQPKISLIKRGLLDGFSISRLMRFLEVLGCEHEIIPKHANVPPMHVVHGTQIDLGSAANTAGAFLPYSMVVAGNVLRPSDFVTIDSVSGDSTLVSPASSSILHQLVVANSTPVF